MLAIPRMQLVTFPLPAALAQTPFPPVENLIGMNVRILGIASYTSDQLATDETGAAVVSAGDAPSLLVTLQMGSDQRYQSIPYLDLVRQLNSGMFYQTTPFPIDLQKSFIQSTAAITASNAALMFYYELLNER